MRTPTIKVGGELIWLDPKALAKGEVKLDRESISEQCDGCGRDIMETGELARGVEDNAVRCTACGDHYAIVERDVE
jgi:hypothetical protein